MPTYNLDPGEFVVLQQSGVWLLTDDGQDYLDELVLTNTHLILVATVSEGLFHSSRYLKRLPLEETLDDAGVRACSWASAATRASSTFPSPPTRYRSSLGTDPSPQQSAGLNP